jgi:transcriptional regulator with XRE-family HTH domain
MYRLERGLTLNAAAAQIGVSPDVLRRAELGEVTPHPGNAKKIADFYGHRVTDLWPITSAQSESGAAA